MKFGVVGVIAFAIDFGLMVLLHETIGMDPVIAAAVSFSVSTIFNYIASMRFVFTHRDDLSKTREFTIFVILSVIGLIINEICMVAGQVAFEGVGVDLRKWALLHVC
jgi:putative flippase GtrA